MQQGKVAGIKNVKSFVSHRWMVFTYSTGTSDHDTADSVSPYEWHTGTVFT